MEVDPPPQAVGFADEILNRHRHSQQPASQQLCAVVGAVLEVVQAAGLQPSPTAIFAAVMSALENPETQASAEVVAAMCTLLDAALGRTPNAVLRSKAGPSSAILNSILERHGQEATVVRPALGSLGQVTAAVEPVEWPSAARPFAQLLRYSLDGRPKVRKRAQAAVLNVLAAAQGTAALPSASEAVLKVAQGVLPGPEAAAKAAAAAPNKKRQQAEAAITQAVADALHLISLIRQVVVLLSGNVVGQLASILLKLYVLQQPLLSRAVTETLQALVSAATPPVTAPVLAELLQQVLALEVAWNRKDADSVLALTQLVEAGYTKLHEMDPSLAAARLPAAFHALVPQLVAEQEGVRFGTQQALKNLVHDCLNSDMVSTAVSQGTLRGGGVAPAQSIVAAVASSLGARGQDGWTHALPVVGELLVKVGPQGAPLVQGVLLRLGELCAGVSDAAEAEGGVAPPEALEAAAVASQAALGAAIRHVGPETVLHHLPLNLLEALEGRGEARTWLIPLLRQHVSGAHLDFWSQTLLPLASSMGSRAAAAGQDPQRRTESLKCRALELQLWETLPSFCDWAQDTAEAFRRHARSIGAAFDKRGDLRVIIANSLERLCLQNRQVLKAGGVTEGIGFSEPAGIRLPPGDDDADVEGHAAAADVEVPSHYTIEVAQRNAQALRDFARNWLPLLFNAFMLASGQERPRYAAAIAAYSMLTDATVLSHFFREVVKKLLKVTADAAADLPPPDALKEGGDSASQRKCTFMELALCLAPGLSVAGIEILYKAIRPALQERDQAVQKKAYKVLAYICEHRQDFLLPHFGEVLAELQAGVTSSMSAAKRFRLRCLKAVILLLEGPQGSQLLGGAVPTGAGAADAPEHQQVVAGLISEIVLCIKEVNQKTRVAAYELLVELAQTMHDRFPPPAVLGSTEGTGGPERGMHDRGGLYTLFSMVLGGVAAATPHMIAASVMALARLMYEFAGPLEFAMGDLLPAVLSLLRTKSREVVKAVLGFVKVVAMRFPVPLVLKHLAAILEGILLWADDSKNQFKLKVRVVVERLARRCGFDAVSKLIPEQHRRLVTHIRKERVRKERIRAGNADQGGDARSTRTGVTGRARTAAKSAWAHSEVFSDEEGAGEGAPTVSGVTAAQKSARGARGGKSAGRSTAARPAQRRLGAERGGEPLDLLDSRTSRALVQSAAATQRQKRGRDDDSDVNFAEEAGRMIIQDEEQQHQPGGKRKRRDDPDNSDDSDFDDIRHIHGATAALRAGAKSDKMAASKGGRSRSGKSFAEKSSVGGRSAATARTAGGRSAQHTGDRFKARKGAKGDTKGKSSVEPYAYWPMDRKLLNRRSSKQAAAKKGLQGVVKGAKAGAAKGRKAKRQRT